MTTKEWAEKLDGRECPFDISREEQRLASNNNIVIVCSSFADKIEFLGAIKAEISCMGGGKAYIDKFGLLQNRCEDSCPNFYKQKSEAFEIEAEYSFRGDDYSWIYKTKIPHETFEIFQNGKLYCRGIVFHMDDVKALLAGEEGEESKGNTEVNYRELIINFCKKLQELKNIKLKPAENN